MVHDAGGGRDDDVSELTRRQELDGPGFQIAESDRVARVDDTSLVDAVGKRKIV